MCARFGCGHAWWVVFRRPLPMYPNVALASVVPCQAGVSVLLQPHGPDVAYVLPAVQKIAQMGAERGEKRQREWGRGCEVLYDGGKCTSLPFLADLLFLQMRLLSHWMIWLNSGCFLFFFTPPPLDVNGVICTCTLVAAAHAQTCLPPHASRGRCSALISRPSCLRCSLRFSEPPAAASRQHQSLG